MKLLFNSAVSLLAEIGVGLCILISVFMTNSTLGVTMLGLYVIEQLANFMIRRQYSNDMKKLFENSEKL